MLISLDEKRSLEFRVGRPWNMPCVSDVPLIRIRTYFPHGPSLLTSLWDALLLLGH